MVNVLVFAVFVLLRIILRPFSANQTLDLYNPVLEFFVFSSDPWHDLTHPWTVLTYAFLHEGFFHLVFNMLMLYWFGRIVGDFIGNHRVLPIYIYGAIAGALFFFLGAHIGLFYSAYVLGASGSVMAFVLAAGVLSPDYNMRLLLLGEVKIKYIVLAILLIDLVSIANMSNTGGHIAHLGGASFGAIYILLLRRGTDLASPLNALLQFLSNPFKARRIQQKAPRRVPHLVYKRGEYRQDQKKSSHDPISEPDRQQRLDAILDKIKAAGYDSLTEEEKEFLYQASKS